MGINPQTLRNWISEEKQRKNPESARILELEAELKAEKRRNAELKDPLPRSSKRALENEKILEAAKESYNECRGMCGLDKMLEDVRESFSKCSGNRLYKIQRDNQLYFVRRKKFKVTTNSNHKLPVAENLLNQAFRTERPGAVWVSDFSYFNTSEGWLYLATVKDIFTKDIVG